MSKEVVGTETRSSLKFVTLNHLKDPVYRMRYMATIKILEEFNENHEIKWISEFGCAEMQFLVYMVNSSIRLRQINLIDIKEEKLRDNMYRRAEPNWHHYINCREFPLEINVQVGSIGLYNKNSDPVDAVVAIEVIEHLYPNILEAVPYNIFGVLQPRIVVMTTPNSDFNVLFANFNKFRDPDHKFEWSRKEFTDWAMNITVRFPDYKVTFEGVAEGVKGTEHLGCVSQLAVFERTSLQRSNVEDNNSYGICTYSALQPDITEYRLIEKFVYPHMKKEDFIIKNIRDYIYDQKNDTFGPYYNSDNDFALPIYDIVDHFNKSSLKFQDNLIQTDEEETRKMLEEVNYELESVVHDGKEVLCVVYKEVIDDYYSEEQSEDELWLVTGEAQDIASIEEECW